jgi:hypothetical protein
MQERFSHICHSTRVPTVRLVTVFIPRSFPNELFSRIETSVDLALLICCGHFEHFAKTLMYTIFWEVGCMFEMISVVVQGMDALT